MERENSRNLRRDRSNEKQPQSDAASFPGRAARKGKINLNHGYNRESVGYLRNMTTMSLNDLYERGSL
jgi:hypothetical protein